MLALAALLMLQLPPAIGWLITVVLPTHTVGVPLITAGNVITVTVSVALQPVPNVYVTGTRPPVIPLTTPVMLCIVPIGDASGSELHVPPDGPLVRLVAKPAHTVSEPLIGVGLAFTFSGQVAIQLVGSIYDIITEPAAIPVTTPLASTVATAVLLLTHVPPGVALFSTVIAPSHTFIRPVMGEGSGLTVKLCERIQPVAGKV